MRKTVFTSLTLGFAISVCCSATGSAQNICGDGNRQGAEECDNGANNSDTRPDACRTNCVKSKCGDGTQDSGEQCDEGVKNSDQIPGACRTDCRNAYCGDGVRDEDEECDDGNADPYDGCHQCARCYQPKDNLVLYGDARLCPGRYELQDQGQEGIIIVDDSNVTLDCQGSAIVEINPLVRAAASSPRASQSVKQVAPGGTGRSIRKDKSGATAKSAPATPKSSGGSSPPPAAAYAHKGTGIVINGENVVLRNCNVEGFKIGVRVKSVNAVVFDNNLCRNTTDIQADQSGNYGVKNSCGTVQNWEENGKTGCTQNCR